MAARFWSVPLLLCLCLVGLTLNATLQALSGVAAAAAQSDSSFRLRVDVDLATIEVAVLDKEGIPVSNLKKEDFRLYEDGKIQEILSIDEVNARTSSLGAGPIDENATHRGKIVLIIFDDRTIPQLYFQKSRDSAAAFVKKHMRPQDLFAVACWGSSLKIFQNLTDDRQNVLAAIAQTATFITTPGHYSLDMWRSLEEISRSLEPLKGQKSVLIYGRLPNSYGTFVSEINGYRRAVNSAKRSNVIYYTIDPGSTAGGSLSPDGAGVVSRNRMSRVDTLPQGQAYTLGNLGVPWLLAAESGGFSISNTNDIDAELDKLDQQLSNYYILGFQSSNPKHDGAFRSVKIKTELKGVTLKYRPGYQDRRPVDALASSRQEQRLLTALATPGAATQLPVVFRPLYFYLNPRGARVFIAARVRMEKTAFRKKGEQIGTDLNIMGAAYAEDGSIAARFSQTLPVSFDKEREPEFRKGSLAYRNYFKLRPGKYRLKLAVSDESNNLGSIEQSLEVPAFPDQGFAGSSIVIAEQTSQLPDLIRNLQTQLLEESDPLLYQGVQIEPSVENRLRAGSVNLPLMFRLYNLPCPPDRCDLEAKVRLLGETGKEYALDPISLKSALSAVGDMEAAVVLSLSFQDVQPGKYRLLIETSETASLKTVTLQTDLEFIK
jgi:VWFA-related protein